MNGWNAAARLSFRVLYPYGIYICVLSVVSMGFQQAGIDSVMGVTCIGACLTSLILYRIYKKEYGQGQMRETIAIKEKLTICVQSICACLFLNVILLILAPNDTSSQVIYASGLFMQIVTAGIAVPIVEELLFRGLGFFRLREYMDFFSAGLISSLAFALYHGSLFQGIYAGLMGFLFAWITEKKKAVEASILAHITVNVVAILLTAFHVDQWMMHSRFSIMGVLIVSGGLFVWTVADKRG